MTYLDLLCFRVRKGGANKDLEEETGRVRKKFPFVDMDWTFLENSQQEEVPWKNVQKWSSGRRTTAPPRKKTVLFSENYGKVRWVSIMLIGLV